ncbi:MAG: M20 family metallopeptidase [Clostridiales bacterium]|jgi:glutamate carboxypeptidase|nr:M20 family metallopeptidase [Clostridiales bacterium]
MERIFTRIDTLFEEYKSFWISMCSIEARSCDRDDINRLCDLIEEFSLRKGFHVLRQIHEEAGDAMVITFQGKEDLSPATLLAHMDTVHKKGVFGSPAVTERNGILYGPGVVDCKGGIACALLTMDAMRALEGERRTIKLILNSDEESEEYIGDGARDFIVAHALGSVAVFNCETGRPGQLTVGRKGILKVKITTKGTATHAGNAYFTGHSAIREMARVVLELEAGSETDGVTYNCGLIQGGTASNIVPDSCAVTADIRFYDEAGKRRAFEHLDKTMAGCHDTRSGYEIIKCRPAMEDTEDNRRLFKLMKDMGKKYGLEELEPFVKGGGSDSAYTVAAGLPTVCSVGPTGMYEHTTREQADIASLPGRAKLLSASITAL